MDSAEFGGDDAGETGGSDEGAGAGSADGGGSADEGTDPEGGEGDEEAEAICAALSFDNILDEAACVRIQGQGVELAAADEVELCRRLWIDLLGSSPTDHDYEESCKWRSTEDIVDDFMSRPDYVRLGQRHWADVFHFTSAIARWQDIADLDAKAGELYTGETSLGEFAVEATTHPAFLGRWDGLDLVAYSFLAFLGRDANPAERVALMPLWRMWDERDTPDPFQANARGVVLDTRQCAAPFTGQCHSELWGDEAVVIETPVPGDMDPNGANVIPHAQLSASQLGVLRRPGELIAAHEAFYESFVDDTLERYFGYDLGSELPAVRQRLVALMVETGGDVVALERTILTSQLYGASNEYAEAVDENEDHWDPPYWHGPLKLMDAEVWLTTAAKLTGVDLGHCDHRYPEVQSGASGMHPHNYPLTAEGTPDYGFRDRAALLGGCPDQVDALRELRTGLIAALTQATITEELCGLATESSPIFPLGVIEDPNDKTEDALRVAADQVYASALVKPIPADAMDGVMAGVDLCRDDLNCTPTAFAAETCRLVLKSADLIAY